MRLLGASRSLVKWMLDWARNAPADPVGFWLSIAICVLMIVQLFLLAYGY